MDDRAERERAVEHEMNELDAAQFSVSKAYWEAIERACRAAVDAYAASRDAREAEAVRLLREAIWKPISAAIAGFDERYIYRHENQRYIRWGLVQKDVNAIIDAHLSGPGPESGGERGETYHRPRRSDAEFNALVKSLAPLMDATPPPPPPADEPPSETLSPGFRWERSGGKWYAVKGDESIPYEPPAEWGWDEEDHCRRCGVHQRFHEAECRDEDIPPADEGDEGEERDLLKRLTRAVRKADQQFEQSGGSSRHWVVEQFLPCVEEEGLRVIRDAEVRRLREEVESVNETNEIIVAQAKRIKTERDDARAKLAQAEKRAEEAERLLNEATSLARAGLRGAHGSHADRLRNIASLRGGREEG